VLLAKLRRSFVSGTGNPRTVAHDGR
jgi:hypothetical protein